MKKFVLLFALSLNLISTPSFSRECQATENQKSSRELGTYSIFDQLSFDILVFQVLGSLKTAYDLTNFKFDSVGPTTYSYGALLIPKKDGAYAGIHAARHALLTNALGFLALGSIFFLTKGIYRGQITEITI